jgi:predicted nuclease of restriction endonuclease-like (RecB) superfamily
MELIFYKALLTDIKSRIQLAQVKATFSANAEMIALYWDIGKMIALRQKQEGWAASVIPKLSKDLKNELPEVSGFSERNLGYMIRFAREYQNFNNYLEIEDKSNLQQPVANLDNPKLLLTIPWGHHALLMEKIKDQTIRFWYMQQTLTKPTN